MTEVLENKLRWQSRRGTLELDLILDKFWQKSGKMPESELRALGELLALDDEKLKHEIKTAKTDGSLPKARVIRRMQNP